MTTMVNVDAALRPSPSIDMLRLEAAQKVRSRQQHRGWSEESHSFLQPYLMATGSHSSATHPPPVMGFARILCSLSKCAGKSRLELREGDGEVVVVTAGASLAACIERAPLKRLTHEP
ncbi:hypothetical protein Aduo_005407 [Ancylostoma duodenale]